MIAVGIGLLWVGYWFGLWSYSLIRGYNLTATQLLKKSWSDVATAGLANG